MLLGSAGRLDHHEPRPGFERRGGDGLADAQRANLPESVEADGGDIGEMLKPPLVLGVEVTVIDPV